MAAVQGRVKERRCAVVLALPDLIRYCLPSLLTIILYCAEIPVTYLPFKTFFRTRHANIRNGILQDNDVSGGIRGKKGIAVCP